MINSGEDSWRLKLDRAQVHLDELSGLLRPFGQTHEYRITETVTKNGEHVYRAWSAEPGPQIAVVLGDFLFNVRSALDHLAVALVPAKRKRSAFFPILTTDPDTIDASDSERCTDRPEAWEKATTGMPNEAVTLIRGVQPFSLSPPPERPDLGPEDALLAVLSSFQNADKHRRLITTVGGLVFDSVIVRAIGIDQPPNDRTPPQDADEIINQGAVVYSSQVEMNVEAKGTTKIAAGIRDNDRTPYASLPEFPVELLALATDISDRLEPLTRHRASPPAAAGFVR